MVVVYGFGVRPGPEAREEEPMQKVAFSEEVQALPLEKILVDPGQPRRNITPASLASLVQSIQELGVQIPLLVRPTPTTAKPPGVGECYTLVAGERRLRAAKAAGLMVVPAVVRELSDADARTLQMVENLAREDLTPLEEAGGYQALADLGLTYDQIGERVGRSKGHIGNLVRLLKLPQAVQEAIAGGKLTAHHGRALAVLVPYPALLEAVGREVIRHRPDVDQLDDNLGWWIQRSKGQARPLTTWASWGPQNPLGRHGVLFAPAKAMPVKSLTPVLQKHAAAKGTFYHPGACTNCPHGYRVKHGEGICLDPAGACYGIRQQNAATVLKARETGPASRDDKRIKAGRARDRQRDARRWTAWLQAVAKAQRVFRSRRAHPKELYLRALCEKVRDFQITPVRIAAIFGPDLEALKVKPAALKEKPYDVLKRLPERILQQRLRMIYAVEDAGIREWRRKDWPFKPPVAGLVGWGA